MYIRDPFKCLKYFINILVHVYICTLLLQKNTTMLIYEKELKDRIDKTTLV